jgi:flagellar motor protein MotB
MKYDRCVGTLAVCLVVAFAQPKQADPRAALAELSDDYDKLTSAFQALQKQLQQILDDEQMANRQAVADLLRLSDALKEQVDKGAIELNQKGHQVQIVLPEKTLFRPGQAAVTMSGRMLLLALGKLLADMPNREVRIGAHTSAKGGKTVEKGDFRLSTERALAVLVVLAAGGVAADRLSATGYGSTRHLTDRRVEIFLIPTAP